MILAVALRISRAPEEAPFDDRLYLTTYLREIFDDMGITLFPLVSGKNLSVVTKLCDGLILPGSSTDIDPACYGRQPLEGKVYTSKEYEYDRSIIKAFAEAGKPILGICGGMQSINVYFGGTLHQRITGHLTNGAPETTYLTEGSFLYKLYGKDTIEINSYHQQAVDDPAPGFIVSAKAKDGIAEAIEMGNIIGVQWHPEILKDMEFFRAFVNMCIPK